MSARLKLKKANDRIRGAIMQAERAEIEQDAVCRAVAQNTCTLGVKVGLSMCDMVRATGHYIQDMSERTAHAISQKFCEHLAEYIRLNLNLSDVGAPPYNQVQVKVVVPKLSPNSVCISGMDSREPFRDWRDAILPYRRKINE